MKRKNSKAFLAKRLTFYLSPFTNDETACLSSLRAIEVLPCTEVMDRKMRR